MLTVKDLAIFNLFAEMSRFFSAIPVELSDNKADGMPEPLIDPVLELLKSVFPTFGTQEFYLVFGSCTVTWILVARVFMGFLKSGKGLISAAFGLAIPLFVGFAAYGLSDWHLVPMVDQDWAGKFLPLVVFLAILILTSFITSRWTFALDGFVGVFVFCLATAAAVCAYFCAEIALETLDQGEQQIQQREDRRDRALDSLL